MLLVGHEPDLSTAAAELTGARLKMRKGGMAIVDGRTLVALLRPAELAAIAAGNAQHGIPRHLTETMRR